MYNKKLPGKIIRNVLGKGKRREIKGTDEISDEEVMVRLAKIKENKKNVLFQIKTIDVDMKVDGKPDKLKGGKIYNVVAYKEGYYYVTDKKYKPGVQQLVPWFAAKRI